MKNANNSNMVVVNKLVVNMFKEEFKDSSSMSTMYEDDDVTSIVAQYNRFGSVDIWTYSGKVYIHSDMPNGADASVRKIKTFAAAVGQELIPTNIGYHRFSELLDERARYQRSIGKTREESYQGFNM